MIWGKFVCLSKLLNICPFRKLLIRRGRNKKHYLAVWKGQFVSRERGEKTLLVKYTIVLWNLASAHTHTHNAHNVHSYCECISNIQHPGAQHLWHEKGGYPPLAVSLIVALQQLLASLIPKPFANRWFHVLRQYRKVEKRDSWQLKFERLLKLLHRRQSKQQRSLSR